MARKRKVYEDDDGRTIVPMDVDGMPWYAKRMRKEERQRAKADLQERIAKGEALTRRETLRATFYAVLAGLTVVGIVGGGVVLFIFILWLFWK
ncbi:MAG: hypothetical protein Q4C01_03695 [Clostridia bacterium]|nr:hypothetical protein [Clostridia bacterium]